MSVFRLATLSPALLTWGTLCAAQQSPTDKTDKDLFECVIVAAGPSDQFDCGSDKLNNPYLLVGTISAVHPATGKEEYLEISQS